MYQYLKTHFSFLMCFLVIAAVGCTDTGVSREFSYTMKDGDHVVIEIEYKPKSAMNLKGEKIGSYYFHAKHSFLFRPVKNERIYISFYDRKGHLLLKGFTPDGYSTNFSNHERNTFDSGVEWKGQFYETTLTVENFRDIHSITVHSIVHSIVQ